MTTPTMQVKLTLPVPLAGFLQSKAQQFGLPLTSFIRHILIKEVEEEDYPVFQASKSTEQAYKRSLDEEKKGKLIRVKSKSDLDRFFAEF